MLTKFIVNWHLLSNFRGRHSVILYWKVSFCGVLLMRNDVEEKCENEKLWTLSPQDESTVFASPRLWVINTETEPRKYICKYLSMFSSAMLEARKPTSWSYQINSTDNFKRSGKWEVLTFCELLPTFNLTFFPDPLTCVSVMLQFNQDWPKMEF